MRNYCRADSGELIGSFERQTVEGMRKKDPQNEEAGSESNQEGTRKYKGSNENYKDAPFE